MCIFIYLCDDLINVASIFNDDINLYPSLKRYVSSDSSVAAALPNKYIYNAP